MKWTAWKVGLAVLAVTTLIGLAEAMQVLLGGGVEGAGLERWIRAMSSTMPSWYVLALLLPPTFWLARRFSFGGDGWRKALPVHLAASIAFTAVHLGLSTWISIYVLQPGPHGPFLTNVSRSVTLFFVLDALFYWGLIGGYHAFESNRRLRERERISAELRLKASRLETSLSRANLEALRMQLNPHFLFNTLNTISVLAMKGERNRVVRMINRLSDLLRLSLENNRQTVTLGEEVDFLQRYLEIEQVRFRERLTVRVDVPEDLLDAEVPSLVLQPLVENAVVHGVSRQLEGGTIEISAQRRDECVILRVHDSGPGFGDEAVRNGTGVGLSNTAARLEELYGAEQAIERENDPQGGATITITIPYRVLTRDPQDEVEWKRSAL